MKKLIVLFIAAALLLSGCSNRTQNNNNINSSDTTPTENTAAGNGADNTGNSGESTDSPENTSETPQKTEKETADSTGAEENNSTEQNIPDKTESGNPDNSEAQTAPSEKNNNGTNTDFIPDKTESTYQQIPETVSDDPFAEWYELELNLGEEYESFIERIDRSNEAEAITEAEFEKFISDNAETAWRLAGFCHSFGPDCFNITGQEITIDGIGYIEVVGPVSTEEEFWKYLGDRFSQRITDQIKNSEFFTEFKPLLQQDGKLYTASGAKGTLISLDRNTIELVYQSEDRIIISVNRSYAYDGGTEKKVFRSIVKEDGKWKFDFSNMWDLYYSSPRK